MAEEGEITVDQVEVLAKEMGWNPDFKGTDREKVDARTYILRSRDIQDTMRTQIRGQTTKIEELGEQVSSTLKNFQEHQVKVHKATVTELNREIAGLKKERKTAIKESDADLAEELDEKIDALKEDAKAPAPIVDAPAKAPRPAYTAWLAKNEWHGKDEEMTESANYIAGQCPQGLSYDRLLKHVDTEMRKFFPEKFEEDKTDPTPNKKEDENEEDKVPEQKQKAASVESGTKKGKAKSKYTRSDLTDDQKKVMDEYIKMGASLEKPYTAEQHIQGLVDIGELS